MFIQENSKPREKLKAWYLFTDDFIAGTAHLTNTHIGCYVRLLCWNWNKKLMLASDACNDRSCCALTPLLLASATRARTCICRCFLVT